MFQEKFLGSDPPLFRPAFAAQILSQPDLIANLAVSARDLLAQHPKYLQPSSFLATIAPTFWVARAVVIRNREKIIGIVYLRERLLMGIRLGIIVADASLGHLLVAETEHRESVFLHAIHAITKLPGVLSLRLRMSEVCMERSALSRFSFGSHSLDFAESKGGHHILRLPRTYQEFLGSLRPKTRATFRRYRRLGREERTLIEELNPSEFKQRINQRADNLHRRAIAAEREYRPEALAVCFCEFGGVSRAFRSDHFTGNARRTKRAHRFRFAGQSQPRRRIDDQQRRAHQKRQMRNRSKPNWRGVGAKPRAIASRAQSTALVAGSIPSEAVQLGLRR